MAWKKKNGGNAFPSKFQRDEEGMSLRDYFATQALASFMGWSLDQPKSKEIKTGDDAARHYAEVAYKIADAMLAEREKGNV